MKRLEATLPQRGMVKPRAEDRKIGFKPGLRKRPLTVVPEGEKPWMMKRAKEH